MIKNCYKEYAVEKTEKQEQAIRLVSKNETTLLEGGGRSGKTFIALYIILVRCLLWPESRHLISRFRFSHIKQAICHDTMPKLITLCGLKGKIKLNKSDWYYELYNGSNIWVGGLDDKERTEKILGNEYATIFLNEASQISYEAYETIVTRLNPPIGLRAKMMIDYNPPSIHHWGYKMFRKRQYPDGRPIPKDDFGVIQMNPCDNPYIDKGYIRRLNTLSESKRKRYLYGEYSIDSGKLWKRAWISYNSTIPQGLWRIVVGVDPTGSVDGDEVGIVVTALYNNLGYVLDDYSLHGSPNVWADEVYSAYEKWGADVVVAEKNYGGDMVKSTLNNTHKNMNVKLITSSRSKIVRAEPISALYEQGLIKHRVPFSELEDEMCTYDPAVSKSPNRMDGLVFGFTELFEEELSMLDAI
jgi:hypothetical protein